MTKWRESKGISSVEMALVLPILMVLALGATDLGRMFHDAVTVANAARAGVSYGSLSKGKSKNTSVSSQFAHDDATNVSGGITVTSTRFCECSDESSVDCETGACDSGSKSYYVRVRAQKTYTTTFSYPGIPSSVPITRDAYMQAGVR